MREEVTCAACGKKLPVDSSIAMLLPGEEFAGRFFCSPICLVRLMVHLSQITGLSQALDDSDLLGMLGYQPEDITEQES